MKKRHILAMWLIVSLWLGMRIAFDVEGVTTSAGAFAVAVWLLEWLNISAVVKYAKYRENRIYWRISAKNDVLGFIA
jgi:hypothetical protein